MRRAASAFIVHNQIVFNMLYFWQFNIIWYDRIEWYLIEYNHIKQNNITEFLIVFNIISFYIVWYDRIIQDIIEWCLIV